MPNFGVEYETCFKCSANKYWIDCIKEYALILKNYYDAADIDIKNWTRDFENQVIIIDDDSNYWIFKLDSNFKFDAIDKDLADDIVKRYKYPFITIDSTVVCKNTFPRVRGSTLEEYGLNAARYSINIEIVSPILKNMKEFKYFYSLFIEDFKKNDLFIKNKSQGIHLNVDVSSLIEPIIKKRINDIYIKWENDNKESIRPFPSIWARPFNNKKIQGLSKNNVEIDSIMTKTNSIYFKKNAKILEFRLLSPYDEELSNHVEFLLSILTPDDNSVTATQANYISHVGGVRKSYRKKGSKDQETRKTRKPRKEEIYIFVYGSLRKGLANSYKLADAGYMGLYKTKDKYAMVGLRSKAYPYVIEKELCEIEPVYITGELYKIDEDILAELDILEGHPHEYTRKRIPVTNGKYVYHAYMYIIENPDTITGILSGIGKRFVVLKDGDWINFMGVRHLP